MVSPPSPSYAPHGYCMPQSRPPQPCYALHSNESCAAAGCNWSTACYDSSSYCSPGDSFCASQAATQPVCARLVSAWTSGDPSAPGKVARPVQVGLLARTLPARWPGAP